MTIAEIVTMITSIITALGVAALGIWSARQDQARGRLDKRLDENDDTTLEHGNRITRIEEHIQHLPTAESVGRLHEKMNAVGLEVADIKGGQRVLTELLSRFLGNGDQPRR